MSGYDAYLRNALSKYQQSEKTKKDILSAVARYCELRPSMDQFVFNDGSKKELVNLQGTVPVMYKGNTYNIPVCLWLLDSHPYNPPMVYVRPTSNMQIKQGKHVDSNGRVYLPYLHEWKHPNSDLLALIQIMTIVFGESPPVFSKTAGQTPYPVAGGGMPMPSYPPATTNYGQQPITYPAATRPGYPLYPSQAAPYGGGYPPYPNYQATQGSGPSAGGVPADQIRASLKSAVEEKMRRRMREMHAQSQAELDTLRRTQEDLVRGKQRLADMLEKLEREQNNVEQNMAQLREADDQIKQAIDKMGSSDGIDIDNVVVPTAPLYRQLLLEYSQEQATEDTIYYLGEALKEGVIDLDVYLKKVRELSRKQFMCRALIQKCRQKAGLSV